jgi:PKD repeat protein
MPRIAERRLIALLLVWIGIFSVVLAPSPSHAADWFDSHWTYRRALDVNWDSAHPSGDNLAMSEIFTAGHIANDGRDIRVTAADGSLVPVSVLQVGPGDKVRFVFALTKPTRNYYVYFGNPDPAPPPASLPAINWHCGIRMEMRAMTDNAPPQPRQLETDFLAAHTIIGTTIIDQPFIGVNPFGEQVHTIVQYKGSLFAPVDGSYEFAGAAAERGALYIDGQLLLTILSAPGDIRFNGTIALKRGPHDFLCYEAALNSQPRLSIGWKPPTVAKVDVIERTSFGVLNHGIPGRLESVHQTLTADFGMEYMGECFFANYYTQHFRFTAALAPGPPGATKVDWSFGDGQVGSDSLIEHVYLEPGLYSLQVTEKSGQSTDTQTTAISVDRDFPNLDKPLTDAIGVQSRITAEYDLSKLTPRLLPIDAIMQLRATRRPPMLDATKAMLALHEQANAAATFEIAQQVMASLLENNEPTTVRDLWASVPNDSPLKPRAAIAEAQIRLWWLADIDGAIKTLGPLATGGNPDVKRVYGQALILSGKSDEGRRLLEQLPVSWGPLQRPARSGAAARTIEYEISDKDVESGQHDWETWAAADPPSFLEGYSVELQTELMVVRKVPGAAAEIAADFANAVPASPYSPQLLESASKLLQRSDPARSAQLRATLKSRYPEDPLSQ